MDIPLSGANLPGIGSAVLRDNAWFRAVLDVLPAAVYIADADGLITYFNGAAADLWGARPALGKSEQHGSWKLLWPDGRPMAPHECPMATTLREDRPVHGLEAIVERSDGTRVPFVAYPTPLHDQTGALVGAVNMMVETTDRKRADIYAQRLAAIVEFSDDAILSKDLNGIINSWNKGAERLFGYTAEETIGHPVTMLIPEDRQDEEPEILRRIRAGKRIDHYETERRRKDGTRVDISLTISPIKDSNGLVIGASKVARDIGEKKRAEEQQVLLIRELAHRIKNTLATVQAVARQTLGSATTEEREAFFGRLRALAGAHDLLTVEEWHRVPLRRSIEKAVLAFDEVDRSRILLEGPDGVWLDPQRGSLLAMTLHELATNAMKYGALSRAGGKVHVGWTPADGETKKVRLTWRETGGPLVKYPEKRGFGSQLIERAFGGTLGGVTIDYHPTGLICTIDFTP